MNTIIYDEIQAALAQGEKLVVATVVKTVGAAPCPVGTKALVHQDGSMQGSIAGPLTDRKIAEEASNALHEGQSYTKHVYMDADKGEAVGSCGATLDIFYEIIHPEPRLILAGAGYVAQALARLLATMSFRIIAVDDRRDFANPQAFDSKVKIAMGDIPQTIRTLATDEASWIVIVTRGHNLDKDALRAALATPATYIGMIGSPSKVKHIFNDLLQEGISQAQLESIHAPIGLDLGAKTPDEIALSIAAEILMLRNHASGRPLKEHHNLLAEIVTA